MNYMHTYIGCGCLSVPQHICRACSHQLSGDTVIIGGAVGGSAANRCPTVLHTDDTVTAAEDRE